MTTANCDTANKPTTVLLCGVGGQGAITAADLLARAALIEGYDVKVSEIHGMAQRGGSVVTTVRFGSSVSSMVCDPAQADVLISFELLEAVRNLPFLAMAQRGGSVVTTVRFGSSVSSMVCDPAQADVLISFELLEAVRNLPFLAQDGHLVVNDVTIKPMPVLTGAATMPEGLHGVLESLGEGVATLIDADAVADAAGNRKCANVALLGGAAKHLPISEGSWRKAIESRVPPKTLAANLEAFSATFNR